MPSLRRTFSSPSVRSSPYPAVLSSNIGSGRTNGHGNRRSSGTETSSRRVLADLEWWRVVDGQHDIETELESEERGPDQEQGYVTDEETGGAEHPLTPLAWAGLTLHVPQPFEAFNLPTGQFAALSIAPRTPVRRGHTLQSSSSSVESTPEATEVPLDGLRLSLADLDLDTEFFPALPAVTRDSTEPFRAHSFAAFALLQDDMISSAGGSSISPLSSHPRGLFN